MHTNLRKSKVLFLFLLFFTLTISTPAIFAQTPVLDQMDRLYKESKSKEEYDEITLEIEQILEKESIRQRNSAVFIASENYASERVRNYSNSIFTNKYAEGYPGKRYYAGCENADEVENLAISRGKKLFSSKHINVQPHSGSQANMAAYVSLLKPGDKILSLSLDHGGPVSYTHLTLPTTPYV